MIESRRAVSAPQLHRDLDALAATARRAACRLTGYTLDELLDLSVPDLTAPEDAAPGERLWNSFVRSDDQRGTFTIRRKNGTPVRVVYHAYKDITDGIHVSFLLPADGDPPGT